MALFAQKSVRGPSIKDVCTKLTPPPLSALDNPPLPLYVRTHHKFRRFLRQKVRTFASEGIPFCPHWTTPLSLTADVFHERSLMSYFWTKNAFSKNKGLHTIFFAHIFYANKCVLDENQKKRLHHLLHQKNIHFIFTLIKQ